MIVLATDDYNHKYSDSTIRRSRNGDLCEFWRRGRELIEAVVADESARGRDLTNLGA